MDEADRLCNRIAIVDHGKLVALDTPEALKASVPGSNVMKHSLNMRRRLGRATAGIAGVTSVQDESGGCSSADGQRVGHNHGSCRDGVVLGVGLKTLTVQNTTLDDVFVHYTGSSCAMNW